MNLMPYDVADLKRRTDCRQVLAADLGEPARRSGRAWQWRCVFHDDRNPSLTAWEDGWKCFGCDRSGDAVTWLVEYRRLSFREAVAELGGDVRKPTAEPVGNARRPAPPPPKASPPDADWQDAARRFCEEAHAHLLAPEGTRAREWLARRGITGDDIAAWTLGYTPADTRARWGSVEVYLPRSIVIPALPWYVKLRLPAGKPKYVVARGSQPALYGVAHLRGNGRELVLTEGEFDCILLHRLVGDRVDVATFGSVSFSDMRLWELLLGLYPRIWVGFDRDEAGQKAQRLWLAYDKKRVCLLLVPTGKDWTDAWLEMGDDRLRGFLLSALGVLGAEDPLPDRCVLCGETLWAFAPDGRSLCEKHAQGLGFPWLDDDGNPTWPEWASRLSETVRLGGDEQWQ